MNGPSRTGHRWARLLVGALIALVVGVTAYNLGFSHGVAQQLPAGAAGPYPWPYRPWGFGFGVFVPVLFFFLLLRVLFWGGPWRRGWYGAYAGHYGHYGRGCYPAGAPGVPPMFEEWHRRAHERDSERPPVPPTT
jgi:hypothetical protein